MTLNVIYTEDFTNPIAAVKVGNPRGFKDLTLSVDVKRGSRSGEPTRRIKITNGENTVFLAVDSVEDFVEGLERLVDYGIDGAYAA